MTRQQEQLILRLWREWCKVWPEQYGHSSLEVKPEGYDPVFDVIPSQAYKDFYLEVVDIALNQIRAPEAAGRATAAPARAGDHARVVDVDITTPDTVDHPPGDQQAESA